MSNKDGGPAFPLSGEELPNGERQWPKYGMSLRDYFAAAALQGFWASEIGSLPTGETLAGYRGKMCEMFYTWADTMLAERNK